MSAGTSHSPHTAMPARRYAAVIFDFNGVLWWDSELQAVAWREFSRLLRGTPLTDEEMAVHVHGRVNSHTIRYLLDRTMTGDEMNRLSEQKEGVYRTMCLAQGDRFRLSPGAVELLDELRARGVPLTIATASAWPNVCFFIDHLGLERWFDPARIIFDDGRHAGKPAPDAYVLAAKALGFDPGECMVVEDSRSGIAAGRAAGIGHIIGLGPTEVHEALAAVPGVGQVIASLHDFPVDRLRQRLIIPPPLRGREAGTWQHFTVATRLSGIARRVIVENDFPAEIVARLEALATEIPYDRIRPLEDPRAEDAAAWTGYVAPYAGQTWFEPPWFFVEMYFFRRILEATGYFRPGPGQGVDPYRQQKIAGLTAALEALPAAVAAVSASSPRETVERLLVASLWGNQSDMSIWPIGEEPDRGHLLVDDSAAVAGHLLAQSGGRVTLLLDNAGVELAGDLLLSDYLLAEGLAASVLLHAKPFPTYVSDATAPDVVETVLAMAHLGAGGVAEAGRRLWSALADGRLRLRTHPFWTSPRPFWDMPPGLRRHLAASRLVISKGDANYRRLLGDRHWTFDTPFSDIVALSPAPLAALRVMKAEVACGLPAETIAWAATRDKDWLASGRWGMLQFAGRSD